MIVDGELPQLSIIKNILEEKGVSFVYLIEHDKDLKRRVKELLEREYLGGRMVKNSSLDIGWSQCPDLN